MEYKKFLLITLCTLFLHTDARSMQFHSDCGFDKKMHNINQVEMWVSNYGQFANGTPSDPGLFWPKGTGWSYVFGAGLWFGTIDSLTNDTLVTIGYICTGSASEYTPGLSGMHHPNANARIYIYPNLWPPPQTIFPMAPQIPVSNQDSWCCFSDSNPNQHMPGDTRPIGIEVYQTVYCWILPWIDDIIFLIYDIKNVSHHNLKDCYIGIEVDPDVIGEWNDYATAILRRTYSINGESFIVDNLAYAWDDDTGGSVGFDFLQTPFDLVPGQDKDNDGILDQYERDSVYYVSNLPQYKWDVDNDGVPDWRDASENPQLGLTSFHQFRRWHEPIGDTSRYKRMAGYDSNGVYNPYDTIIRYPDDVRFLMASGPFKLPEDSIVRIVLGIVLGEFEMNNPPHETLFVINDRWAQLYYDMNWFLDIKEHKIQKIKNQFLNVMPNPAANFVKISYQVTEPTNVSLKLYSILGQMIKIIYNGHRTKGDYQIDINLKDLSAGTYFLVLETPTSRSIEKLIIMQ
ncbi:MAG: T9SS type A sorting domain-containing protein [candidate division WOR-3 bacterium]|nr:T9SS type A sorting domain-containing protein [candidate division WOR-3 bacterium]